MTSSFCYSAGKSTNKTSQEKHAGLVQETEENSLKINNAFLKFNILSIRLLKYPVCDFQVLQIFFNHYILREKLVNLIS